MTVSRLYNLLTLYLFVGAFVLLSEQRLGKFAEKELDDVSEVGALVEILFELVCGATFVDGDDEALLATLTTNLAKQTALRHVCEINQS